MRKSFINYILIATLLLASCSGSRITSTWRATSPIPTHYNKILVLGLIHDSQKELQEQMENHLAGDLRALGYDAVTSFAEFGPKAFDKLDEPAAIEKLKKENIEAVITIVLLSKEKERKYVPANIYASPYGYYRNHFWGYRTALYHRIYEPGYYVTDTKYFWESNLYEMNNQQLLYSVQTETFESANAALLGHEYGKLIAKDMVKQGVLTDNAIPKPRAF